MTLVLLGAAFAAPFLFHEAGHWAVAWYRRVPLVWRFDGWRLVWRFPEGAFNTRERREIGVAGFVAEYLGIMAFLALVPSFPVPALFACAVYAVVASGHLWHYAVYVDSANDDFRLIR